MSLVKISLNRHFCLMGLLPVHIIIGFWAPMLFCNTRYGIILFQVMSHLLMCSETSQTWHQEILTDWKGTLTPKIQTGKQNYDNKGYTCQLVLHTICRQTIEGSRHQRWLIASDVINIWSDEIIIPSHVFFFPTDCLKYSLHIPHFFFCCCP